MSPLLLCWGVLGALPAPIAYSGGGQEYAQARLDSLIDQQPRLLMHVPLKALEQPKQSPVHGWTYSYIVAGMGRVGSSGQYNQRFRIYTQEPVGEQSPGFQVTRMLMRLWDYNVQYLGLDHATSYGRTVDVYLSKDGKAGGEQRITMDPQTLDPSGRASRVNVVHIYDLATFTNPLEKAREVAHEYGHATLPAIGGYSAPESWANGDVGERIYLQWLYDDMLAGRAGFFDTADAKKEDIAKYLAEKVDPLVKQIASNGPQASVLQGTDRAAFFEYVALVVYGEAILPRPAFRRFLLLTGDGHGKQALPEIVNAAAEVPTLTIPAPAGLTQFWVPLGKGRVTKGTVLRKRGDWAEVKAAEGQVVITNPPITD